MFFQLISIYLFRSQPLGGAFQNFTENMHYKKLCMGQLSPGLKRPGLQAMQAAGTAGTPVTLAALPLLTRKLAASRQDPPFSWVEKTTVHPGHRLGGPGWPERARMGTLPRVFPMGMRGPVSRADPRSLRTFNHTPHSVPARLRPCQHSAPANSPPWGVPTPTARAES